MPSKTVEPAVNWVVSQPAVSGSLPTAAGPSCQVACQAVGPPVASPAPFGVPSLFQRSEPALLVVDALTVALVPEVTCAAKSGNEVMRGPRPPDGLLTSATSFCVWVPRPVFQLRLTVTRRKSSGWMSGSSVPAAAGTGACGVQTFAG